MSTGVARCEHGLSRMIRWRYQGYPTAVEALVVACVAGGGVKVGIEIGGSELTPPPLDDPEVFRSVGLICDRCAIAASSAFNDARRRPSEAVRATMFDA